MRIKIRESPVQKTVKYENNTIVFNSRFDSGNFARIEQTGRTSFTVWAGGDCYGTNHENNFRSWFHFSVKAVPGFELSLTIKGIAVTPKLYKEGMRPVFRNGTGKKWKRVKGDFNYKQNSESTVDISFVHIFTQKKVYFAFTYPWSYTESQELMSLLEQQASNDSRIYFHRENLIYSLDKRRCDILTISSKRKIRKAREPAIENLFPNAAEKRPRKFSMAKKIVFISARVHPGETPAAHVMNGILYFLMSDDPRAIYLRDMFVFKLVPMVNPDGVARGNFRTDQNGVNLNRVYNNPIQWEHPTVFAIKKLFLHYNRLGRDYIHTYLDLHGHTSKKGWFIYGNVMDFLQQVESFLIPKLIELNCPNFDFIACNFSQENPRQSGQNQSSKGKDGCGRVALWHATGMVRWYTMECNFNSGRDVKTIGPSGLTESHISISTSKMYQRGPPKYKPIIFQDVGKSTCIALLDSIEQNPYSRLPASHFQNLEGLRTSVAEFVSTFVPFKYDWKIKKASKNKESLAKYLKMLLDRQSEIAERNTKSREVLREGLNNRKQNRSMQGYGRSLLTPLKENQTGSKMFPEKLRTMTPHFKLLRPKYRKQIVIK